MRLVHWLRITPRLQFRDKLQVVGQLDVPRGFIAGQTTRHVQAAEHPMDKRQPLELAPRWLYLDWMSPVGLVRVGQQPSHWGMGILANDGDHPTLFGDYRDGSIVERVLFATRPGGKDSPFNVALAGDLVFKDPNADLVDGDRAFEGVLAAFYQDSDDNMLGLYGVYRDQRRDTDAPLAQAFDEKLQVWVMDSAGRFNAKIPGARGHVFGGYEVAYVLGKTNYVRTLTQTQNNTDGRCATARCGRAPRRGDHCRPGRRTLGRFRRLARVGLGIGRREPERRRREALHLRSEPQRRAHPLQRGARVEDGARCDDRRGPGAVGATEPGREPPADQRRRRPARPT